MAIIDISTPLAAFYGARTQYNDEGANQRASVWGSYIPLSMGYRRVPGSVIWAGDPYASDRIVSGGWANGGFTNIMIDQWHIRRPFAVALGYRLNPNGLAPKVRRIWVDGTLVYSLGTSYPLVYDNIKDEYNIGGLYVDGVYVFDQSGTQNRDADGNLLPLNSVRSTLSFTFHDGSETQLPDPLVVAQLGEDAPSFRGMMYLVIKDYIVGNGHTSHELVYNENHTAYSWPPIQELSGRFPVVEVELVDGIEDIVTTRSFAMLDNSANVRSAPSLLTDWSTRQLTVIANPNGFDPTAYIFTFDMDAMAQLSCKALTGVYDGVIQGMALDKVNHLAYCKQSLGSTFTLCSVDVDGNILDSGFIPTSFGASASNGFPVSDTNPADKFPELEVCDIGYAVVDNAIEPLLFGGATTGDGAVFHCRSDGTLPDGLTPQELFGLPAGYRFFDQVRALPLWRVATQDQHLTNQDAAFVYSFSPATGNHFNGKIYVAYVGIDPDGRAHIKGNVELMTGSLSSGDVGTAFSLALDVNGNLLVQESGIGKTPKLTKFKIDYKGSPDYTVAPGWRGLFPKFTLMQTVDLVGGVGNGWDQNLGQNSNLNKGTLCVGSTLYDLETMTTTDLGAFSAGSVWDSDRAIGMYDGSIPESDAQTFSGRGLYWTQAMIGLVGDVDQLKGVLESLAVASGRYTSGSLNIDSSLTAEVPGVLITKPYDLGTLFNSMGAMYEFSYFNSGGRLTFRRSSNSPLYATGTAEVSSNPQDGDTITIGAITYRFKNVMSAPYDVQIGANTNTVQLDAKEKSIANLLAAVMADTTLGRDTVPFFMGTVLNPAVTAKANKSSNNENGYTSLIVTSTVGGVDGNSVVFSTASGGRLTLVPSSGHLSGGQDVPQPTITLTLDDLCIVGENQITENDALVTIIPPTGESQKSATVVYYAMEQDYKQLAQTFSPDNQNGETELSGMTTTYDLPLVMSSSEAYARVSGTAFAQADMVVSQNFRLPQSYLLIEPNDVLGITIAPYQYTVRVDEATFNGDFSVSIAATNFSARTDVPINNSDSRANLPQTIPDASDSYPLVIDAPVLDPTSGTSPTAVDLLLGVRARWGFSFSTASFVGAKTPLAPAQLFDTDKTTKWGVAASLPALVEPWYSTVEDSITITLKTMTADDLASATDYQSFVAGENCIAVGAAGRWEYIFFRDVTVINPRLVKLTGLIRAQRGTDEAAQAHKTGDVAVLIASASSTFVVGTVAYSLPSTDVGSTYQWAAIGSPSSSPPVSETDEVLGHSLYPFSPCHFKAALAAGNDLDLSWVRRDRLGTEFVTTAQPLSETSEKYDVEIMNGSTIVRTLTDLSSPAYTYSSADQATDGFSPPLANLKFRVYQKGELGRGFPHEETVNVD